ncbi:hypothetical protein [Nostoc sp.]
MLTTTPFLPKYPPRLPELPKGTSENAKDDVMELTKRFGVLASIRGVDANMGGSALNRVASGTMGIGEALA